jgi:hypothetical protein
MRYLINEPDADEAALLALYRAVIAWAATHADRFVISLQRDIYDDPDTAARFSRLGEIVTAPDADSPKGLTEQIRARLRRRSPDDVQIIGTPGAEVIRALTEQAAPRRAIAGDLSPVEEILLFNGDRAVYALYDYGRTQVLDLDEHELTSLRETIGQAGFDPTIIVAAPPYSTGEP